MVSCRQEQGNSFISYTSEPLAATREKPDASLSWLLEVSANGQACDSRFFERVYRYTPVWEEGRPALTGDYSVQVEEGGSWLNYAGKLHFKGSKQRPRWGNGPLGSSAYVTAHGVIFEQEDRYSWCFVSDRVTGNSDLESGPSIGEVDTDQGLVVFIQRSDSGRHTLWAADPIAGTVASFKKEWFPHYPAQHPDLYLYLLISESRLYLFTERGLKKIPVAQIKKDLEKAAR